MYNPDNKQTYWYADENLMISTQSVTKVYDDGRWDGIEKALHAYICYGDSRFIQGIKNCWKSNGNKLKGQRYPTELYANIGISRDHTIYSFVAWKLAGYSEEQLYYLAQRMPFNLGKSLGMKMTPSLWLWLRLISGKQIGKLWYLWQVIAKIGALIQNKVVSFLFNFDLKETPQTEFVKEKQSWIDKLLFPTYALKLAAFQFYVLPDSFMKRAIQKLCQWNTPSENFLLKLMFGGKVELGNIFQYKSMYGDRWSDELNPRRTRGDILEIITNPEHLETNTLDKDLLETIYNKLK